MKGTSIAVATLLSFVTAAFAEPPALKVTFQQLLAHPERFAGKRVDVIGYYHAGYEESSLHASKRADEHSRGCEDSIWVNDFESRSHQVAKYEDLQWKMVRLRGTFRFQPDPILGKTVPYGQRYRGFGTYKMWAREIIDITYFQPAQ